MWQTRGLISPQFKMCDVISLLKIVEWSHIFLGNIWNIFLYDLNEFISAYIKMFIAFSIIYQNWCDAGGWNSHRANASAAMVLTQFWNILVSAPERLLQCGAVIARSILTNIHKRWCIAHPLAWGMGCRFWIQHLVYISPQFLQLFMS